MTTYGNRAAWLKGPGIPCEGTGSPPRRPYRLILLGAPGIGKGTQAQLLHEYVGACPLSTGDVFRAAKGCNGHLSPAMQQAMGFMQRGELVPDETVISMIRERAGCLRCNHGFMLDGFPRTVEQARRVDLLMEGLGMNFDAVLSYELPRDQVIARLSGRRTCSNCGRSCHIVSQPPASPGICDSCGGTLFQREDDRAEAIAVRLRAYEESKAPLSAHYEKKGLLRVVDADGPPEVVLARALALLGLSADAPLTI